MTGGSGFIGRGALPHVIAAGGDVHATTSGPTDRGLLPGPVWHRVDLLDPAATAAVVAAVRPTHLVHLAWHVVPGRYDDPANARWVGASLGLLEAFAASGGQRAVLVGSCYEDDVPPGRPAWGPGASEPRTAYGRAKAALGARVASWAEGAGVACAWARIFNAYGPGEDPRRLVAAVIVGLLSGQVVPTTAGDQVRDLLHTSDIGTALAAVLDSDLRGPVDIGSGEPVAIREVIAELAAQIGRPDLLAVGALPGNPGEPPRIVADSRLLRERTGWRPQFDLPTGLADTIAWWRDQLGAAPAAPASRAQHMTGAQT